MLCVKVNEIYAITIIKLQLSIQILVTWRKRFRKILVNILMKGVTVHNIFWFVSIMFIYHQRGKKDFICHKSKHWVLFSIFVRRLVMTLTINFGKTQEVSLRNNTKILYKSLSICSVSTTPNELNKWRR